MSNVKVGDLLYWPDANRLGMVREVDVGIGSNVYVEYIPMWGNTLYGYFNKEKAAEAKKALDKLRKTW